MITSGLSKSRSNWFSISLPPVMRQDVKSVFLDMALKYSDVWMAISRVGERITQRAPTTWECCWSF